MKRIDLETLVKAFEDRIDALNKNPIEVVSQKTIVTMLKDSLETEIKNHFTWQIRKEVKRLFKQEFKRHKTKFVKTTVKNILNDSGFRTSVEDKIKKSIINGISK